jgi:hypothetical protein
MELYLVIYNTFVQIICHIFNGIPNRGYFLSEKMRETIFDIIAQETD